MIGAVALLRTLVAAGVDTCFMNPGTSEMHFVDALDTVPEMRGVLCLFEGVATGAADGYARMTGRPAAALVHLGPGLGNGLANLHNARRARVPLVCVVGAHATYHAALDAPLQSDSEALARWSSGWVHSSGHQRSVGDDAAQAVAAARDGQVATLVLPADVSWSEGAAPGVPRPPVPRPAVDDARVREIAGVLAGPSGVLLIGGAAAGEAGLRAAARIATATGVRLMVENFPARTERGAGVPDVERVAYLGEAAEKQFAGATDLVLAGAVAPVSFFAYPGRRNDFVPDGCATHVLAAPDTDVVGALEALADLVAAGVDPPLAPLDPVPAPTGPLNGRSLVQAVGATLPEGAVLVDEAITASAGVPAATATAPRHSLLTLTGGAIGDGLPVATGAAIGAPGRSVVCVQADGSALYTLQALWTQAREQLDVTTVLINNGSYAILQFELDRVGAAGGGNGDRARDMFRLDRPRPDFVALASGLGVPAERVTTADELVLALRRAHAEPGPHLIEAMTA